MIGSNNEIQEIKTATGRNEHTHRNAVKRDVLNNKLASGKNEHSCENRTSNEVAMAVRFKELAGKIGCN